MSPLPISQYRPLFRAPQARLREPRLLVVLGRLARPRMPMNCPQELVFAGEKQIPPTLKASPVPGGLAKARRAAVSPRPQAQDLIWGPAPPPAPLFAYPSTQLLAVPPGQGCQTWAMLTGNDTFPSEPGDSRLSHGSLQRLLRPQPSSSPAGLSLSLPGDWERSAFAPDPRLHAMLWGMEQPHPSGGPCPRGGMGKSCPPPSSAPLGAANLAQRGWGFLIPSATEGGWLWSLLRPCPPLSIQSCPFFL